LLRKIILSIHRFKKETTEPSTTPPNIAITENTDDREHRAQSSPSHPIEDISPQRNTEPSTTLQPIKANSQFPTTPRKIIFREELIKYFCFTKNFYQFMINTEKNNEQ